MRILVVEDEGRISSFLKHSLEAEYYAVDLAADGEEGSYLARTNEYDLVILDNVLPKKIGIQVCQEVRALGKTLPILILSVKTDPSEKVAFLNAGADDYMAKPFVLAELLARIRALLRRPAAIASDRICIRDLCIDIRTAIVTRGKKELRLTRKEFMLLHYLMKNAGSVLSRGMILEHVWDMHADLFSNTIESHILSLRRKIGDKARGERFISTIPGRGYKMELGNS